MNNSQKPPILAARNLSRWFNIAGQTLPILNNISLEIATGECLFLCGASGAGKTTLLYTLAGLERPQKGHVELDGSNIFHLPDSQLTRLRNQRMGFVFQSFFLLPELTALENVILPSLIAGRPSMKKATYLLERVGLGHRLNHLPPELSGGEQQRVAIARALVNDPDVIFADEPTGNLDSATGQAIMHTLLHLAQQDHKTLVIVTHDQNLAKSGDRILHIKDGKIMP